MKQDWVIWTGCGLLFCAGAIWGGGRLDIAFFKVANIHDLFEIFSSLATVAAVFLAFSGVNAWRQQLGAQSDHALAQRVAIAALKYKEISRSAYDDALFSVTQFRYGLESVPESILDRYIAGMEDNLKANKNSKAEFCAVLLESRALWGAGFSEKYDELLALTDDFYGCIQVFIKWARLDPNDSFIQAFQSAMQRHYDYFERQEWLIPIAEKLPKFDELTRSADAELRKKLFGSS